MVRAFLLLGSNEGDRHGYLEKARVQLSLLSGKIVVASSLYQTAAWGETHQPAFLNQVVEIETPLLPEELLKTILNIESALGRVRTTKWARRTIDIDILFYGVQVIETPNLIIPHPAIAQRRFTLVPLTELAPDLIHPSLKKTMKDLLASCQDPLAVEKVN